MGVPPPTLCPEERQRRRLAWRNERNLYHRTCDATGKKIISMFSPEKPFPVYCNDYWWSDQWDARDYGKDFDFTRPFFEQFLEFQKRVPKISLIDSNNENCDFCNIVGDSKNCYLLYGSIECEDCYYGSPYFCKDSVDSLNTEYCELTYDCLDSAHLYRCSFMQNCHHTTESLFCYDVLHSHHCFCCVGLRNKKHHILNKAYAPEEYQEIIKNIFRKGHSAFQKVWDDFEALKKQSIHKNLYGQNNENATGDNIFSSKNVRNSYQIGKSEDIVNATRIQTSKDIRDTDHGEWGEDNYEFSGYYYVSHSRFSHWSWGNSYSLEYCSFCVSCNDCFACIGLKNAQYCILNKQYSKEEYFALREKIIEHMNNTGEWGEFFPIELSPFAYNETVAQEYFPLTKETVGAYCNTPLQKAWKDDEPGAKYDGPKVEIPETIAETPDDICNQILTCETCTKNYRIVKPELAFYRKMNLPVPHNCPDCRHKARMALRNPRKLWKRNCDNCGVDMETTFSPERPEKVFCEKCYLESVL
jgi:Zn ribbon nucleic-acid-binding protein